MFNLYFKLSDDFEQKIYMRSMKYMTTLDTMGNEYVEIYDPKKFISLEEYFEKAKFIGRYLTDYDENKLVLLYDSNILGIGYNLENEEYEIIPAAIMMQYHNTYCFDLGDKADKIETEPTKVISNILKNRLKKSNNYNHVNLAMEENVKRLSKVVAKKEI